MKRILISCLLGIGALLPSTAEKSYATVIQEKRIINVNVEGWTFLASSDSKTGTLVSIDVYDPDTNELLLAHSCSGYSCSVNLSSLGSGSYYAIVTATHGTKTQWFNL